MKAVETAGYGKLLVTARGFTLYRFTGEKRGKIECAGGCAKLWPPLLVKGKRTPIAGPGIRVSKLGTVKRPGGARQVAYYGHALYRYAPDRKPGDVKGQGVDAAWYVIGETGKVIRMTPATAPATTPPPPQTTPTPPTVTTPPPYGYG